MASLKLQRRHGVGYERCSVSLIPLSFLLLKYFKKQEFVENIFYRCYAFIATICNQLRGTSVKFSSSPAL